MVILQGNVALARFIVGKQRVRIQPLISAQTSAVIRKAQGSLCTSRAFAEAMTGRLDPRPFARQKACRGHLADLPGRDATLAGVGCPFATICRTERGCGDGGAVGVSTLETKPDDKADQQADAEGDAHNDANHRSLTDTI